VASSRTVIVAGAGIGGLTTALMLARTGFRVTLLEQAERLSETGAGIQLSPNATNSLIALGLGERLRVSARAPEAIAINSATGGLLTRIPLGGDADRRYSAPYWSIHRADLQAALVDAVTANPDIVLRLGTQFQDYAVHANGLSVACRRGTATADEQGIALVGADGLWSQLRSRLGYPEPQFRQRTAWRALIPADDVARQFATPEVQLWLGQNAHVVNYPVRGGTLINVVAIVDDTWAEPGWSANGEREELLAHFSPWNWAEPVRDFLSVPKRWMKWALYDLPALHSWGDGPVTLLGDAAHPMLPFLAQGAAMAIEDAAILADSMARQPDDPAAAMRRYERTRLRRTARVQRAARNNGRAYHLTAGEAWARNLLLRLGGGKMLLRRYNWLYGWRAPPPRLAVRSEALARSQPTQD
jgi:salicylate hydroxylase